MEFKHFQNANDALVFMVNELISTLEDDLDRMENSERDEYTDEDREAMINKIADMRSIEALVVNADYMRIELEALAKMLDVVPAPVRDLIEAVNA